MRSRRPLQCYRSAASLRRGGRLEGTAQRSNTTKKNYEYACGVLFMTIFPPYFLVYDQTLLAFPLVMLWASPAWRWGVLLLAVSSPPLANLSFALGFSVTGVVALAAMVSLAREVSHLSERTKGAFRAEGFQMR